MPFTQRVAASNPFCPQPHSFCGPMLFYCFNRIFRACGIITAVVKRQKGGECVSICAYKKNEKRFHSGVVRSTDSTCFKRAMTPRSISPRTGLFSFPLFFSGTIIKTRWCSFPCEEIVSSRICLFFRYDSLSRRFIRLRLAAGWIPRARANPTFIRAPFLTVERRKHRTIPCWYGFPPERTFENDW